MRLRIIFQGIVFAIGVAVAVEASNWPQLVRSILPGTPVQRALFLTSAIAMESGRALNVWLDCTNHRTTSCYSSISRAIGYWSLELAALSKVNDWYKEGIYGPYTMGNLQMINIDHLLTLKYSTTEVGAIRFKYSNNTFKHKIMMPDRYMKGEVDLLLLGTTNGSGLMPLSVIEACSNGTWVLTPLEVPQLGKSDGIVSVDYISGDGSVIVECEYGASEQIDWYAAESLAKALTNGIGWTNSIYSQYRAFVGTDSKLKCAFKVEHENEKHDRCGDGVSF